MSISQLLPNELVLEIGYFDVYLFYQLKRTCKQAQDEFGRRLDDVHRFGTLRITVIFTTRCEPTGSYVSVFRVKWLRKHHRPVPAEIELEWMATKMLELIPDWVTWNLGDWPVVQKYSPMWWVDLALTWYFRDAYCCCSNELCPLTGKPGVRLADSRPSPV